MLEAIKVLWTYKLFIWLFVSKVDKHFTSVNEPKTADILVTFRNRICPTTTSHSKKYVNVLLPKRWFDSSFHFVSDETKKTSIFTKSKIN